MRRWTPAFLATFTFQGVPAAASLLRAVDMLRDMNGAARPSLPKSAPTGFIRERWARHVLPAALSTGATTTAPREIQNVRRLPRTATDEADAGEHNGLRHDM